MENDVIKHPEHYTNRKHECWDEMEAVFGKEAVITFCKLNVWKYRYRAGSKGSREEDLAKADQYMDKMISLQNELELQGKCND